MLTTTPRQSRAWNGSTVSRRANERPVRGAREEILEWIATGVGALPAREPPAVKDVLAHLPRAARRSPVVLEEGVPRAGGRIPKGACEHLQVLGLGRQRIGGAPADQ